MRIIAGSAGSVPLFVPRTLTRPTTDRVRESLFATLGDLLSGARVLDLFAGSGSLGLEALSRGAASADFVESHGPACAAIERNLEKSRLVGGRVHRRDALAYLGTLPASRFDLVFADPPYARDDETRQVLTRLLGTPALADALTSGGLLVLESLASAPLPESVLWSVRNERDYGTTRVSYLVPNPAKPDSDSAAAE